MGLQELRSEIRKSALDQKAAIEKGTAYELAQVKRQQKKELQQIRAELDAAIEKRKQQMRLQMEGDLKKTISRESSMAKQSLLDDIFAQALDKIAASQKKNVLARLLKRAEAGISIGTVYVRRDDLGMIKKYAVKERELKGGLIAETEDGLVSVDCSFETLFARLRESLLGEVAGMVFTK